MAQSSIAQASGHNYTTSATALKYRTKNSGNPLQHDDVDANFDILRKAINGLVTDHGTQASEITALQQADTALGTRITNITNGSTALPMTNITGLATALAGKVDDNQVLTNVPSGAVFSDTVYSLPVADTAIGGVKEGGDIDIDSSGNMTVKTNSIGATEIADNSITSTQIAAGTITSAEIAAGAITATQISSSVNLSSADWLEVKRFKLPYVGNKYATTGYTIDGGDDNFDGTPEVTNFPSTGGTSINGGVGHGATAMDGNLTTGKYWCAIYYPGNTSNWYTNTIPFNLANRQRAVSNSWIIPHNSLHNASYVTQNPPCYTGNAGSGSLKVMNYIYGIGQSFCTTMNGNTTWVRCRSDGKVDLHLRSGNSASWSYAVVTFLKYE